jgi:hypothetical protein
MEAGSDLMADCRVLVGGTPQSSLLSPQLPWVCEDRTQQPLVLQGPLDCGSLLGFRAVYRMCFATAAFFFFFMLLMICVRSSRDPRAAIQNG